MAQRNRCGQIKRSPRPSSIDIAASQPHRRSLPKGLAGDARAESAFGRLNLASVITDAQYEAGCKFASIVHRFRATIETPKAPRAAGLERTARSTATAPDAAATSARRKHEAARSTLAKAGSLCTSAVLQAAVEDMQPWPSMLKHLRKGLDALHEHFA
jgi:hypothetical protein